MSAGDKAAIMIVLLKAMQTFHYKGNFRAILVIRANLLPPKAFCSNFVRTESRYGTMTFFFPMDRSAKAEMTFPRAESDLLIFAPSFSRSPVAPVLSARSDPEI